MPAILNLPRLKQVRDHVVAHPDQHDQGEWFIDINGYEKPCVIGSECGTAACVAGWTVLLNGDQPIKMAFPDHGYTSASSVALINGGVMDIDDRAQQILGLTDDQAQELFYDISTPQRAVDYLNDLIASAEADVNPRSVR
jgi:hypothetical protein